MTTAIYPGSFDPVTYGHLDIIERAANLFDHLIVAVAQNMVKRPLFTAAERVYMLKQVVTPYRNVEVDAFEGLTVDYARRRGARVIVRGLRAISDFENEFMMALTNKKLAPEVETMFLMTRAECSFMSSRAVREIAYFGGCLADLVPPVVAEMLRHKFRQRWTAVGEG